MAVRVGRNSRGDMELEKLLEKRRRRFAGRAEKEKRIWYSRSLKRCKSRGRNPWESRKERPVLQAFLWLLLGAASLAASGCIAFYTSSGRIMKDEEIKTENESEKWLKAGEEGVENEQKDGWEKEFFGVHIRFWEGQISVFREREEMKKPTN